MTDYWDTHPKLERDTSLRENEIVVHVEYHIGKIDVAQSIEIKQSRLERLTAMLKTCLPGRRAT